MFKDKYTVSEQILNKTTISKEAFAIGEELESLRILINRKRPW